MEIDCSLPHFSRSLHPSSEFEEKTVAFVREFLSDKQTISVQTSGSTGTPKIFDVEKNRMNNSARMTCDFLGLKEKDTALLCLPVEYISGKMMVVRSIERKLMLSIEDPSLSPLKNISKEIDFCAMTPLQVENSLDKLHWMRRLIIGGAAVSESLKRKIGEIPNLKSQIFETYGMSETLSHIALKEIFPQRQEYFHVLNGVGIGQDERGCLTISAPQLHEGTLFTNDLVELGNEKSFKFLGRVDHVINSGGAKIFPEQLEELVKKEIPNEVVFLGLPDEKYGQQLVLAIEGDYSVPCNDRISSVKYVRSFERPKEVIFVEKFPRTPNGKVDRRALLTLLLST